MKIEIDRKDITLRCNFCHGTQGEYGVFPDKNSNVLNLNKKIYCVGFRGHYDGNASLSMQDVRWHFSNKDNIKVGENEEVIDITESYIEGYVVKIL